MFSFRSRDAFDLMIAAHYDPQTYDPPLEEEVRTREDMIYDEPARGHYSQEFQIGRKAAKTVCRKEATLVQEEREKEPSPIRSESREFSDIQPAPTRKLYNPQTKKRNQRRTAAKRKDGIDRADLIRGVKGMMPRDPSITKRDLTPREFSKLKQSPTEPRDSYLVALNERKLWLEYNSNVEHKRLIQPSPKEPDAKKSTTRFSIKGAAVRAQLADKEGSGRKEESNLKQHLIDSSPSFHKGPGLTLPAPHQRKMRRWSENYRVDRYVTPGAPVSEACYDEFYLHPQVFSPSRDDLMRSSRERSHLALKPQTSPVYVVDAIRKDLTDVKKWAKERNVDRWVTFGAPVTSSCFDEFYLQPQEFSIPRDDLVCSSHGRKVSNLKSRRSRSPPRTKSAIYRHRESSSQQKYGTSKGKPFKREESGTQDRFSTPVSIINGHNSYKYASHHSEGSENDQDQPSHSLTNASLRIAHEEWTQPAKSPTKKVRPTTLEEAGAIVYVDAAEVS